RGGGKGHRGGSRSSPHARLVKVASPRSCTRARRLRGRRRGAPSRLRDRSRNASRRCSASRGVAAAELLEYRTRPSLGRVDCRAARASVARAWTGYFRNRASVVCGVARREGGAAAATSAASAHARSFGGTLLL